jgi:hypothetical protein
MAKLKNNLIFQILSLIISGCGSNPTYEIKTYPPNKYTQFHVLNIDSRRITHECLFFNAKDDQNWRHHYYMHILNDKNEVMTVDYPTDQDIDDCTEHLKKVEKIFKKSTTVKMCIRGEFNKEYANPDKIIDYKDLGKHAETYHLSELDTICNTTQCYSINETWINTCPGFVQHYREK